MAYVSTSTAAGAVTQPQSTLSSSQPHQPPVTLPSVFVSLTYLLHTFYVTLLDRRPYYALPSVPACFSIMGNHPKLHCVWLYLGCSVEIAGSATRHVGRWNWR